MKNSITIDGKTVELPEELINQIKNQLKTTDLEQDKEDTFLSLINGLTIELRKDYPDSIFYKKDNEYWMEYNSVKKYVWLNYDIIWSIFKTKYSMSYEQIQQFTQTMLQQHLKLEGVTTYWQKLK